MIGIIDFGSQFTQVIARKIRELGIFSEILPNTVDPDKLKVYDALILTGGPRSVLEADAPTMNPAIWDLPIPILGICYGFQLMALHYGGSVSKLTMREYGKTAVHHSCLVPLFKDVPETSVMWMSHADSVSKVPPGFELLAATDNCEISAFQKEGILRYGVQFHPEVHHSVYGINLLRNFVFTIVKAKKDWDLTDFIRDEVAKIKQEIGDENVICGISGGIDSAVAALLVSKACGDQLSCIFVDHGLLRAGEARQVEESLLNLGLSIQTISCRDLFLSNLNGIADPEEKRKIIGRLFIEVFEKEAKKGKAKFLVQGTLYPDMIESSGGVSGLAAKIKSHHNVGGLPEKMGLKLIEPLRLLFKDEVRELGKKLGLSNEFVNRHPFPGPGLAIRIIGEVTEERLAIVGEADLILREEIKKYDIKNQIWQGFTVLLPIKTVGVMGDERTYQNVVAIRLVESVDGMTANFHKIPYDVLELISTRITNEVKGVNRVVYDVSSKPPATIEWE
jgi:GMP synthase (glutamine-hydrolysing)